MTQAHFWISLTGSPSRSVFRYDTLRPEAGGVHPEGLELTVADTCHALGLGQRDGTSSPIVRTLERLTQFDLACDDGMGSVAVRRNLDTAQWQRPNRGAGPARDPARQSTLPGCRRKRCYRQSRAVASMYDEQMNVPASSGSRVALGIPSGSNNSRLGHSG